MSRFFSSIYDLTCASVEAACLAEWRRELLGHLEGDVLEIGAGTGANLRHYPRTIGKLVLTEPDPHMRRRLAGKTDATFRAEIIEAGAERLPFENESFDVVVSTLVCCSVASVEEALAEIHRVLRPEGRLVFLEHVAADPSSRRYRWQRRIEPLWKRVAGNCHLTRRTEDAITHAGFELRWIRRESMRRAPPIVRPTIRGVALKSSSRSAVNA